MKKYCCDEWNEYIKEQHLYYFSSFKFCPWCGCGIEHSPNPEQIPSLQELRDILNDPHSVKLSSRQTLNEETKK